MTAGLINPAAPAAQKPVTIGLLWHSANSGNLGVGALTLGNIALLRRAAAMAGVAPRFVIMGFADAARPRYVAGDDIEVVEITGRAMLPGGAFHAAVAQCDIVCDIGGGDSFADIYGAKRFAYLCATKAAARWRGVPLIFSPQTIGPFTRPAYRRVAALALNGATHVFTRDPQSTAAATDIAPRATLSEAVDVAFAMPFDRAAQPGGRIAIGINTSGLLYNGGYDGTSRFGMDIDYAAYTLSLLDALSARDDVAVHLIAHVNSDTLPQDDDGRVADALAARYPGAIRVADFASPVAAKGYIAGLDMLVAARMHACIAAFSAGVAVVPVAYSRKFAGLFTGALGYPHLVPVTGMTTDQATAFTLAHIDDRAALARDIAAGNARVAPLLDGYVATVAAQLTQLRQG